MISGFQELGTVVPLPRATDQGTCDRIRLYCLNYVRQRLCGLHGHAQLLQFDSDRLFLRCASCGFETPGWQVGEKPPRCEVFDALRSQGILVQVHYVPVNAFRAYRSLGYSPEETPRALDAYQRLISLPLFPAMEDGDVTRVVKALREALP